MDYIRLIKKITHDDGTESLACAHSGTETCQIHSEQGCASCPMLAAIFNMLYVFEEAVCSPKEGDIIAADNSTADAADSIK